MQLINQISLLQDRAKQAALAADLRAQMLDVEKRKQLEATDEAEKDSWLLKADGNAVLQQRKIETIEKELRKQRQKAIVKGGQKSERKIVNEQIIDFLI